MRSTCLISVLQLSRQCPEPHTISLILGKCMNRFSEPGISSRRRVLVSPSAVEPPAPRQATGLINAALLCTHGFLSSWGAAERRRCKSEFY